LGIGYTHTTNDDKNGHNNVSNCFHDFCLFIKTYSTTAAPKINVSIGIIMIWVFNGFLKLF